MAHKKIQIFDTTLRDGTQGAKISLSVEDKIRITKNDLDILANQFPSSNYNEDYRTLKKMLRQMGYSIPVLFKHYSDLCEDDGVKFLGFNNDPDFSDCTDGLILVSVDKIKEEKRKRYINRYISQNALAV